MDAKGEFVEKVTKFRKEKVDMMAGDILRMMLERDLPFYDMFYIDQRVRSLVEDSLLKVGFSDPEVSDARRKLLRKIVQKASRNIPKPPKTHEQTPTGKRNERCEDIAQEIARKFIDEELAFSDDYYLMTAIDEDNRLLYKLLLKGWMDSVFGGVEFSINTSLSRANRALWGSEKEEISMKRLDAILKLVKNGSTLGKK